MSTCTIPTACTMVWSIRVERIDVERPGIRVEECVYDSEESARRSPAWVCADSQPQEPYEPGRPSVVVELRRCAWSLAYGFECGADDLTVESRSFVVGE